jgi:kynureninase
MRGQVEAFESAAMHVDDKWQMAFEKAEKVRSFFAQRLACPSHQIALGPAVHDMLVRVLSALPLRTKPRIVTSDSEFHALRRQLDRLGEEGVEIVKVAMMPLTTLCERMAQALDDRTCAVILSAVSYASGVITPNFSALAQASSRCGAVLIVDAYHAINVVEFELEPGGLDGAYVLGGGYKYAQMGEGNAFLRVPEGTAMRPVVTGWFAEFALLDRSSKTQEVQYSPGAAAFGGSTYDPTSHFRAACVADFWREHSLDARALRTISQRQIGRIVQALHRIDLGKYGAQLSFDVELEQRAGFVGIDCKAAVGLVSALRKRDVWVDARGTTLRFGPAPYLSDAQIDAAIEVFAEELVRSSQKDAP